MHVLYIIAICILILGIGFIVFISLIYYYCAFCSAAVHSICDYIYRACCAVYLAITICYMNIHNYIYPIILYILNDLQYYQSL